MAAARRLSELLQEQQEPFLVEAAKTRRLRRGRGAGAGAGGGGGAGGACCPVAACRRLLRLCNHGFKKRRGGGGGGASGVNGLRCALSKVLSSKAMRRVLRWENLGGGCFPGVGAAGDCEFRRLRRSGGDSGECDPRAMEFDHHHHDDDDEQVRWKTDMEVDSSRQLSPVSVLDLHSDDDSPVHRRWEDEKPSTSGSSAPSEDFHGATSPCFTYNVHGKTCAMEVEEQEEEEEDMSRSNADKSIEEQISSWERIAVDISKIPMMVELDFSESIQQWGELKLETKEIGTRIETLIFEEIRSETVCDMLASHCTLASTSC